MQRERDSKDDFFHSDEPLVSFSGFGGFGFHRSMLPSLFGRRDPFDDPFFTRPFGGSMFQSHMLSPGEASSHTHAMETATEKGIVIEELNSDEEEQEQEDRGPANGDEEIYSRKYSGSSKEPSVEHPDDVGDERKSKDVTSQNEQNKVKGEQHQNRSYSFQTCKVTYGGVDGAYFTSTRSRRAGGDGVMVEETKEADKTTCQATHKISRGIHDKGHSVTRKLNSDGKVDTLQTLHNLNEEELAGFEDVWNCNVKGQFPNWKGGSADTHDFAGSSSSKQKGGTSWGSRLLPAIEQAEKTRGAGPENEARTNGGRRKKVVRINIE